MKLASGFRRRPLIEEIEARILYSADVGLGLVDFATPVPTAEHRTVDASGEFVQSDAKEGQARRQEIVFVDTATPDYQALADDIRAHADADRQIEVVLLDRDTDGIKQISDTLAGRQDVSAVHIIAHGSDAEVELGDSKLDFATLLKNATQIKQWGQALTSDADLLIYGCNVAQRTDGQALMDALARLTGADVNASEDVTGNRGFGGNWNLEYRTGSIETHLAISTMEQAGWRGTLAIGDAPPSADGGQTAQSTTASGDQAPTTPSQVTLAAVPLAFQPNVGQADDQADFLARGNGYSVWLTGGDAVLDLRDGGTGNVVRLDVLGKNTGVAAQGENELQAKTNYLVGSQDQWHQDVANYSAVRYNDIYDGVDLRYYGNQQQLEYDFVVNPGANANNIQLKFEGVQSATVADNGDLVLDLGAGRSISFKAPVAYQDGADGREAVSSSYHIAADGTIGFDLGAYDTSRQLVIDPVLSYSTYLGGTNADVANGVTVDAAGNVYLVGYTTSPAFPTTTGAYNSSDPDLLLSDVFVTKFAPNLGSVLYSTYVGGTNNDYGTAVAVDAAGNAYVTGYTTSTLLNINNFPTVSAYQSTQGGTQDAFLFKLDPTGSTLIYSTYLGGSGSNDIGWAVAVDAAGSAYVTGGASSSDFPTTLGAVDTTYSGGDAFVTKFNTSGNALVYSTFIGGSSTEIGYSIAVDGGGNAVVVGETSSNNLPTTANAYQTSWGKKTDAFVSKLNAAGSAFMYSTYLGGDNDDYAYAVALDSAGKIYLTGETAGNYPITAGAFQPNHKATDAFVSILNPSLSGSASLVYSSYLGGGGTEAGLGIGVDASGRVFVAGQTDSSDFPVTAGAYQTARSGGVDAFMVAIDPLGTGSGDLAYGSYFGGAGDDYADNAVYSNGRFYLTGDTTSVSGIATGGSFDTSYNLGTDAFAAVFTVDRAPVLTVTTTALSYIEDAGAIPVDANLTLSDPDSVSLTGATVQITANYVSSEDVLAFNNSNSWGITGTWSVSTGTLSLVGSSSAANYQAALRSITYQNTSQKPSTATRTVSFVADDGIYSSTVVTRQISVTSVNDAPLNTIPGPQNVDEDAALVFSSASGNPISIVDVDAGNSPIQVTLSASSGKLTLSQITGLTFITGTGSGNQTMTFTGNVANVNAALNGLRFDPTPDFNGTASLQVVTNDQGNTGTGGSLGGASTIVINVAAVNDAPSYSLPGPQSTQQNNALVFSSSTGNAISVADVDAGAGTLSMTLIANQGTLTLGSLLGLASVSGNGSGTVALSGTLAALNGAVNGLLFTPASGYSGPASLQIITNDQGNTGSGLSAVVSGVIAISVSPNLAPLITTSVSALTYTEGSSPAAIDSSLTVVDGDSPLLDHAVVRVAANYAQGEDVLGFTNQLGITGVWNAATGTLSLTGSASVANYQTALRSVTYQDLSEDPSGGSLVIAFVVNDGTADGAIATRAINVIAVNDAPVLTAPAAQTIDEDTSLVFSAANGNAISIVDVDAGSAQIQVTLATANGVLSLAQTAGLTFTAGADGAASMTFTGTVSGINAALNGLNFKPGTDYDGAASITVVANDLGNGGTGGAKSATASIGINITGVNDAPSGVDSAVTMLEDTVYTFTSGDFGFTDSHDSPANNLLALTITSIPAAGTLTLSGTAVTAGQSISAADIAAGKLDFSPVAQANGSAYCSLGFQVQDDGGITNGGVDLDPTPRTMTVNVIAVNDAPQGTDDTVLTVENTAYTFGALDFGFADPNDAPTNVLAAVVISTTPTAGSLTLSGVAVTGGQTISATDIAAGNLQFNPTANTSGAGYATFTFQVQDNGGTANGGVDVDVTPRSMTIDVTSVNDAPIGTNNTVTTNEDAAYTFAVVDFGFSDPNDIPANSLLAVTITTLPSAGQLTNNGIAVSAGQSITLADITGGLLVFAPAADANGAGYAAFTFQVQDDGGTINGGVDLDVTPRTMTVNVTAVNDAPTATNLSAAESYTEDTVLNLTNIVVSDVDSANVTAILTLSNVAAGSLTTATSGAVTSTYNAGTGVWTASGALADVNTLLAGVSFTPALDFNSNFTIATSVSDGVAAPMTGTKTMTGTPVNDAPIGTNNTVTTNEDTAYTFGVVDFGFSDPNDIPANTLAAVMISSLPGAGSLTLSGVAVTSGQTISLANISAGNLQFTPAADANGAGYAGFTFQVQDNGGTASGGVDLDVTPRTMTIDVTSVNDAPIGTDNTVTTNEDTAYTFGVVDFGFSDPNDIPANTLAAVVINSLPGAGSLTLSGVAITSGQTISLANISAGNLQFTPAADANGAGYAGFSFQVQDNGGTANGGVDVDVTPRSMTIDVTAVNDAPQGADNSVNTLENTDYIFGVADFGLTDPNDSPSDALLAVRINSLPGAGTLLDNGVAVTAGQFVSAADIAANLLVFTPTPGTNGAGYANFSFQVQDDGGTANGGVDLDPASHTMTLNVFSVNDAPIGTNNTVTTNEDTAYTFGTADFGFTDPNDIPANSLSAVVISSLPGAGSLTLSGVAVTSGQSISVANITAGNLQFAPAADANGAGYAGFTFQVQDNGGTANGGVDLDVTPRSMTIDVTAVNDAPMGTNNTVTTNEDSAYTFAVVDFGFSDPNDGVSNNLMAVRISTLPGNGVLTDNGIAVTAGQFVTAADIAAGKLQFAPTADANGAGYAAFTFQVQDNGGTANGGVDLDVTTRSMTIDVAAVNDAPSATNLSAAESYTEDTPLPLNLTDIVVSDMDSANVTAILTLSNVAAGGLTTATSGAVTSTYDALTGVWTASGALADVNTLLAGVSFTPALDFNSNITIATSVSDGVAAPITGSKAMTGTPVNDAPQLGNNTLTINQGGTVLLSSANLSATDVDSSILTFVVSNVQAGRFELVSAPGVAVATFTVADVTGSQVRFVQDGSINAPSYLVRVRDDLALFNGPATAASITFNVTPPVVVPPIVVTPPPAPPPAPLPPPSGGGSGPSPAPAPSPSGGTSGPSSPAPTSPTGPEEEAAAAAQAIQAGSTSNLSIISNSSANTNTRAPQISLAVLLAQDPRSSGIQGIRGGSDGPSTSGGEAFSPIAQTETLSIGFASSSSMQQAASPALSAFKTTLNKTEWVGDLDKMRESIDGHANTTHRIVGSTAMVTGGLSVGYVIWLLRGGLLLTSLLSSLPAWNVVDPLPILANAKRSDEENEEDVDPLEKLFGRARAAIRGTRAQDEHEVEEAQPDSATASAVEDKPAQPEAATA